MTTVIRSGGAEGADFQWCACGRSKGFVVEILSFRGHRRRVPHGSKVIELSDADLAKASKGLAEPARRMGRRQPTHTFVRSLLARDVVIVEGVQAVYAVGWLTGGASLGIDGGTAWSCETFFATSPTRTNLFFYDQETMRWMTPASGSPLISGGPPAAWTPVVPPKIAVWTRVACVGSRRLTAAGEAAIEAVL